MEKFPLLKNDQVALGRAELATGVVLDEQLVKATKDEQKVYTVFENVDESLNYAKQVTSERPDVECWISENEKKTLYYITAEKIVKY